MRVRAAVRKGSLALLFIGLVIGSVPDARGATDLVKCQRAVAKAGTDFSRTRAKLLSKCGIAVLGDKLQPHSLRCQTDDPTTASKLAKAASKLDARIAKKCGGADRQCGGDLSGEIGGAQIGFGPFCPGAAGKGVCDGGTAAGRVCTDDSACTGGGACARCGDIEIDTAGCTGVAACVECHARVAVDEHHAFLADDLVDVDPGVDAATSKCQQELLKSGNKFWAEKSKILQKCWDSVFKRGTSPCDFVGPGDGKYLAATAKATSKHAAAVCKKCGGPDNACGGGDDVAGADLYAPPKLCADVVVPFPEGAGADCAAVDTETMQGLADCASCVAEAGVDCATAMQVPGVAGFPLACGRQAKRFAIVPPPTLTLDGADVLQGTFIIEGVVAFSDPGGVLTTTTVLDPSSAADDVSIPAVIGETQPNLLFAVPSAAKVVRIVGAFDALVPGLPPARFDIIVGVLDGSAEVGAFTYYLPLSTSDLAYQVTDLATTPADGDNTDTFFSAQPTISLADPGVGFDVVVLDNGGDAPWFVSVPTGGPAPAPVIDHGSQPPVVQLPAAPSCGNGALEGGELCDPTAPAPGDQCRFGELCQADCTCPLPFCGDGIVNDRLPAIFQFGIFSLGAPAEECDGADDAACPGACGAPGGPFECLCADTPRQSLIVGDEGDLDLGWTGSIHDAATIAGAGFAVELRDCGGADVECTVGPSCALAPHPPCATDLDCPGAGNSCRKSPLATGPHCQNDVQQACDDDLDCLNGPDDFCRKHPYGLPVPISSGQLSMCLLNIFSEDVVGTANVATGDFAVRLRHQSVVHLGIGTLNQPCPTCGNFCSGASGGTGGPGARTLCQADTDCPATATCVTDAVCSFGPHEDLPCRRDPPFGNTSGLFGVMSVDCPPHPGVNVSGTGLDILFDPLTTGTTSLLPSHTCNDVNFLGGKCIGGSNVGAFCDVDSDCGGAPGSCAGQCFCPSVGAGAPQKPNDCFAACRGGSNDYAPCFADSDCPGGLCEHASCRAASAVCVSGTAIGTGCSADSDCGTGGICSDDDSSDEGFCPSGPLENRCSTTSWVRCVGDTDCEAPACPECLADGSETCVFAHRSCFPSTGYSRTGQGAPDVTGVARFCVPPTVAASINVTAGFPGPAALTQPVTAIAVGLF